MFEESVTFDDDYSLNLSEITSEISKFIVFNKALPDSIRMKAINYYRLFGSMNVATDPAGGQFRTLFDIPVTIIELE